jgi:hypothetical protein
VSLNEWQVKASSGLNPAECNLTVKELRKELKTAVENFWKFSLSFVKKILAEKSILK